MSHYRGNRIFRMTLVEQWLPISPEIFTIGAEQWNFTNTLRACKKKIL